MKSKAWAKLQHAPINVSRIRYQPGDILEGTSGYETRCGWIVYSVYNTPGETRIQTISDYDTTYPSSYTIDSSNKRYFRLDCIPNPRITARQQVESDAIRSFPNFHGGITPSVNSILKFTHDERSTIDVQSSLK